MCRHVYRSLAPGGRFLIQVGGKEWLARVYQPRDWREEAGAFVLEERKVLPGWAGLENRWVLIQNGKAREFRFNLRLYSGGELRMLLEQVGFRKVDLYGELDGSPYDNSSRWLIAVGRK